MSEQKDYTDLKQGGDTGENVVDAIQPVTDGEGATQTVMRRPSENLRGRTEALRTDVQELLYYRDAGPLIIEGATGHSLTWAGSTTAAGTGLITQVGDLTIRSLLTPDVSTKGVLNIGTDIVDRVTYTVASTAYASEGMNAVTVEHRDTGATTLTATISEAPVKRILVAFDSTNNAHDSAAAKLALDTAIGADAELAGKLDITDNGAVSTAIFEQIETRIEGTADKEAHVIPSGLLTTFTTSEPLAEGDAIGIWYRYVVEPVGGDPTDPKGGLAGGRRESNPDRATATIPLASLFITSTDPNKIPGAVPLCKVVNNELVWFDGSRFVSGATGPIGTAVSTYVDASVFQGDTTLVIGGGLPTTLTPPTAQKALEAADTRLGELRSFTYTCSDGTASTGGDFNGSGALDNAITALGATGGTVYLRRGTYTVANTFSLGGTAKINVVGEHRDLVTITQAAPASFTFGALATVSDVTLNSNILYQFGGTDVQLRRVNVSTGRFDVDKANTLFDDVTWSNTTTSTTVQLSDTSTGSVFNKVTVEGVVNFTGVNTRITQLHIGKDHSGDALSVDGVNIKIDGLTMTGFTLDNGLATNYLVGLSGIGCEVSNAYINTTGSSLTKGWGLVLLGDSNGCKYSECTLMGGDHGGMFINDLDGVLVRDIGNSSIENCSISNTSTTHNTLEAGTVTSAINDVSFYNCFFGDNEKLGNSVAVFNTFRAHKYYFVNTKFQGATFNATACAIFLGCSFKACTFKMKNPIDGGLGVRTLPGVDQNVNTFWTFLGAATAGTSTLQNVEPSIDDCIFDFSDAEIIDDSGSSPDFDGSYVGVAYQTLRNPSFVGLNRYGNRHGTLDAGVTVGGRVLALGDHATLIGGRWSWTSTVPAQTSGVFLDQGWISVEGDDVTLSGVRLENEVPVAYTHDVVYLRTDIRDITNFTLRDCVFTAQASVGLNSLYVSTAPTGPGTGGFIGWVWDTVQFGSSANPISTTMFPVPAHKQTTINNCQFWFSSTSTTSDLNLGSTVSDSLDFRFTNNLIYSTVATVDTKSPITVNGNYLDGFVFVGNHISYLDTVAGGNRGLFTGTPAGSAQRLVAAGVVFDDREGATTTTSAGTLTFAINDGI